MQVCTSLQTDNHASTPPLSFLQAGCPSCRPTNSVKALKAKLQHIIAFSETFWKLVLCTQYYYLLVSLRLFVLNWLRNWRHKYGHLEWATSVKALRGKKKN